MSKSAVRLHITPLNPDLLQAILGPNLKSYAETASYHQVQTAPESSFGYLELPAMEAAKVQKKLNGAILKGKKLKIEEAKPVKRTFLDTEADSTDSQPSESRRSKRTKPDANIIQGHELSPDRKVKRGWTEPKSERRHSKKKDKSEKKVKVQAVSKHTEQPELLFRTKIPANKTTEETKEKRQRKKKANGSDVVHEFEKTTTMPSFLRHDADNEVKQAVEYKDGEGWVDAEGNVVEKETDRASKKRKAAKKGLEINVVSAEALNKQKSTQPNPLSPPQSKSTSSLSGDIQQDEDETSSSGSSSPSSASDSESQSAEDEVTDTDQVHDDQETNAATDKNEVHPLEALFKKPKIPIPATDQPPHPSYPLSSTSSGSGKSKPSLELSTSFSFFDGAGEDDSDEERGNQQTPHANDVSHNFPQIPMTPFSTQDFRFRQIRSAAPTPDTADIRKSTGYGSLILGEDDPDDVLSEAEDATANGKGNGTSTSSQTLGLPQSEFEKRFWEKRGDNNRAWKARRRAVLKEQRQRENRARRPQNF